MPGPGHGGHGGPGFGGGHHHRPPMGGGMHHRPPMGGGMHHYPMGGMHRPYRNRGCCGCLFPVIGMIGVIAGMLMLLF